MGGKKAYLVKVYEWDCLNGDVLSSEHYIVYAEDEDELREKCDKLLESYISEVSDGWERVTETDHSVIFAKAEGDEEYEHELGYEVVAEIESEEELEKVRSFWTIVDEIE